VYQFFIAIILILGGSSYWLYNENQILIANNQKLEYAVEEQKAAIAAIQESYEAQGKAMQNLQRANARIEAEKDRYLDIFRRHNLDKLAIAKPGLIENRVNGATKSVFEDIENDSKNIADLDSNSSN
jgi:hypothetical protein